VIRWIVLLAGILGAVGVAIGANAAHGLEKSLAKQGIAEADIAKRLDQCDVAVRYHLTHVLALLAIGLNGRSGTGSKQIAALFFLLGIGLFCGGLYSMVYLGVMGHWAIVPAGGVSFMLGWIALATSAFSTPATSHAANE
jgi:uncharacterized membrane protein YgdD (TMEM256/DUF423 family)